MIKYDPSVLYVCVTYTPDFQPLMDNLCSTLEHPNIELHVNEVTLDTRYEGFRSSGWFECLKRKMQFFYDFMVALPDGAVACSIDADIQFFQPARLVDLKNRLEADASACYGQAEYHTRWVDKRSTGVANGGFFMLKKTALVMDWLQSVLIQDYNRRFLGDQEYLNHFLRQKRVPYYLLPPQEFIHGGPVSAGDTKFINRRKIAMHHATYTKSVAEKQEQMNKLRSLCGFSQIDWSALKNANQRVIRYVDGKKQQQHEQLQQKSVAVAPAAAAPVVCAQSDKACALVLAQYNEDVAWAAAWAAELDVFVYSKGGMPPPAFEKHHIPLPNVGREAHTYLTHIIDNYDRLHEVTIFLQGRIDDVEAYRAHQMRKYIEPARQFGFSASHLRVVQPPHWNDIKFLEMPKYAPKIRSGALRRSINGSLLEYAHRYFGKMPLLAVSSYCGCFAASRAAIQQRPKEFYETLRATVDSHADPEEAHFLERLWAHMFSGTAYVPELLNIPSEKRDKFAI